MKKILIAIGIGLMLTSCANGGNSPEQRFEQVEYLGTLVYRSNPEENTSSYESFVFIDEADSTMYFAKSDGYDARFITKVEDVVIYKR